MKKLLLASIALVTLNAGGSALAIDMRVEAKPPPPPPPAYNWTGVYVGGNVGSSITNPTTGPNAGRASGVPGGAHLGGNWQFAPTGVLGIEVDRMGQ
jgi:outer membrane immunogenic protein